MDASVEIVVEKRASKKREKYAENPLLKRLRFGRRRKSL